MIRAPLFNLERESFLKLHGRWCWLLTGFDSEDGNTYEDNYDKELIEVFRDLNDYDKKEIIEIVLLKRRLRSDLMILHSKDD